MCDYIVKMNIFVAPLEVVDDALVSQLLLHNKQVLEEVDDSFVDVEVVKLGDHGFLVLQILLILINQRITFIDDTSDVVKDLGISRLLQVGKRIVQGLVLSFFTL